MDEGSLVRLNSLPQQLHYYTSMRKSYKTKRNKAHTQVGSAYKY